MKSYTVVKGDSKDTKGDNKDKQREGENRSCNFSINFSKDVDRTKDTVKLKEEQTNCDKDNAKNCKWNKDYERETGKHRQQREREKKKKRREKK